jgi:hypothetical protein
LITYGVADDELLGLSPLGIVKLEDSATMVAHDMLHGDDEAREEGDCCEGGSSDDEHMLGGHH